MTGYVLDTNVFNRVCDGRARLPELRKDDRYFATHIQLDELRATKDNRRRESLIAVFHEIDPANLPTASFAADVSRLGLARVGDGALCLQIKARLDAASAGKPNNLQDALIGEAAIEAGLVLVTEDGHLRDAICDLGGSAIAIHQIHEAESPAAGPGNTGGA